MVPAPASGVGDPDPGGRAGPAARRGRGPRGGAEEARRADRPDRGAGRCSCSAGSLGRLPLDAARRAAATGPGRRTERAHLHRGPGDRPGWRASASRSEVRAVNGPADTKGQVTQQDPIADTQVEVNSSVTITVNQGPETATIPDGLVGQDRKAARIGSTTPASTRSTRRPPPRSPNDAKAGAGAERSAPRRARRWPLSAKVTITYATGESTVPNLVGVNRERAESDAEVGRLQGAVHRGGDRRAAAGPGDVAGPRRGIDARPRGDDLGGGRGGPEADAHPDADTTQTQTPDAATEHPDHPEPSETPS